MNPILRIKLSTMMFFQYAVWGAWVVPFATYMFNVLNFQGVHVGWVYNTNQIAAIISPFIVGMIADRFFATEKVLAFLHLIGAGLLYSAAQVKEPAELFMLMLAYSLMYMPTLALSNSLSFRNIADPDRDFPSIRVLGTIGWICSGLAVGQFIGEETNRILYFAAGLSAFLGLFCFTLPHTPPVRDESGEPSSMFRSLEMLKNPSFAVFLLVSFAISVALAFYYQLANPFLSAIGSKKPTSLQTIGQFSEIFFMLLLPFVVKKLGIRWTLTLGMAAWCVRYGIFWTGQYWPVVLIALPLHGICYDFFFVVSQIYVDNNARKELRASAQGLLAFATLGCGMFLGNLLAGLSVDANQDPPKTISLYRAFLPTFLWEPTSTAQATESKTLWPGVWAPAAIGCGIAIILFLIGFREPKKTDVETTGDAPLGRVDEIV